MTTHPFARIDCAEVVSWTSSCLTESTIPWLYTPQMQRGPSNWLERCFKIVKQVLMTSHSQICRKLLMTKPTGFGGSHKISKHFQHSLTHTSHDQTMNCFATPFPSRFPTLIYSHQVLHCPRVASRDWKADPFLKEVAWTYILDNGSIVRIIQHSELFKTWWQEYNIELRSSPIQSKRIKDLNFAKHRFNSTQRPFGRAVIFLDSMIKVTMGLCLPLIYSLAQPIWALTATTSLSHRTPPL